jgi:hypothetical protein
MSTVKQYFLLKHILVPQTDRYKSEVRRNPSTSTPLPCSTAWNCLRQSESGASTYSKTIISGQPRILSTEQPAGKLSHYCNPR